MPEQYGTRQRPHWALDGDEDQTCECGQPATHYVMSGRPPVPIGLACELCATRRARILNRETP